MSFHSFQEKEALLIWCLFLSTLPPVFLQDDQSGVLVSFWGFSSATRAPNCQQVMVFGHGVWHLVREGRYDRQHGSARLT